MYPDDWPRCACGDYCLDGKATCGRLECSRAAPLGFDREYYILSLKYSQGAYCQVLLWWRPDNNGYTMFLEAAGRYKESVVTGHLAYYNDGESTLAIPCYEAERLARRAVYVDYKHELGTVAPPVVSR